VAELYSIQVMVWDAKFQQLYSAQIGTTFHVRHLLLSPHFGVFHEAAEWRLEPGKMESPERHAAHTAVTQQ
jgi:lipopolysaccharide transport system ATP-binding protein